jgi:hypothetical protein
MTSTLQSLRQYVGGKFGIVGVINFVDDKRHEI